MQTSKDGKKERVPRSTRRAKDFKYEDAARRATYTGDAHMSGPQGDMTAPRIELYLKPSGDELDRAEAYDERDAARADTARRPASALTYTSADETYVVTGTPVTIVDECSRETDGPHVDLHLKGTDRIVVDGSEQIRTQTQGRSKCPSSSPTLTGIRRP